MRISPLDIRKQTFKGKMRGADPEEVRIFLDVVASEYEQILQENAMLAERLRSHEARLSEYQKLEENMRSSLVTVERIANESRESSEREARRLVQDAHMRAERILEDARERLQLLVREIEMLRGKKEVFARRFWTLIEGQIAILQEHMTDMVEVDSLRQKVSRLAVEAQEAMDEPPAARAETPMARPETPMARPETPMARPEAHGGRYEMPVARPETPAGRYEMPVTESASPERATPASAWSRPSLGRTLESMATPTSAAMPGPANPPMHAPQPAAAGRPAAAPEEITAEAPRRNVPKGLRNLLRGRQTQLPLESEAPPAPAEPEPMGESAFASLERREGFFELRAGENQREETAKRFRSSGLDRP